MFSSLTLIYSNVVRAATITSPLYRSKWIHTSAVDFAARKGTREKARKKKVAKVVEKKVGFIPHNIRAKNRLPISKLDKHLDDSTQHVSSDNVYLMKYYRIKTYGFAEAVEAHRQTHHPTMYNEPNAPLNIKIELNMQAEKITRFMDKFNRIAMIPHGFDQNEERTIIVFAKGDKAQKEATDVGATLVGGPELIKDVQSGEINLTNFNFVVAHPNILPELVAIRGLMKRRFPNVKSGNLGIDVAEMVKKFQNGVQYHAVRDEHQLNYGCIDTCVGTINMETQKLEENLKALLADINTVRPKREGKFITRCFLTSPPSGERFKIDPFLYVSQEYERPKEDAEEQREDEPEKLAESN